MIFRQLKQRLRSVVALGVSKVPAQKAYSRPISDFGVWIYRPWWLERGAKSPFSTANRNCREILEPTKPENQAPS
jgi:hypothetical protein